MTETPWERYDRQSSERYAREVAAGLHDDLCEWGPCIVKSATGGEMRTAILRMCHCSKRSRVASGFTEPPGPLWFRNPYCPRCYSEVGYDGDSFVCESCHVSWDPENQDDEGTFTDDYGDLGRPVVNQQIPGAGRVV